MEQEKSQQTPRSPIDEAIFMERLQAFMEQEHSAFTVVSVEAMRNPFARVHGWFESGNGDTPMMDRWVDFSDEPWELSHHGTRDPLTGELPKPVAQPQNYTAPSTPAEHATGILYQGEFETPGDGTAQAVRLHARALADTGVPLLLRSFSGVVVNALGVAEPVYVSGLPPEVAAQVGDLTTTSIASCRPAIKHVVIRSPEHLRQILIPRWAIPLDAHNIDEQVKMRDGIYANTIVYSVWERDRIDPGIATQLARVKQCWVPCAQNKNLLVQSGVDPSRAHVVPHPYRDDDQVHVCRRRPAGMHGGHKRFYAIGRWEPRKGFDQLIRAFLEGFKPSDKASLTIKYSGSGKWPDYVTVDDVIAHTLRQMDGDRNGWSESSAAARIALIGGSVKYSQIVKLHFENNIYVSSSHGEAWNLSAYAAKLAGNKLVYVGWGGVVDFAEQHDIGVVPEMQPVHASYRWEHGAKWAGYSTQDLQVALQVAEPPARWELPEGYQDRFSMRAVGQQMRNLVDGAVSS